MRKVNWSNWVDWPDHISTAPFTTGVHVVTRKYAKAGTTSPLRHWVPKGGVLARAGVGRQEPDTTPKGKQFTRELPFPVALGPRAWPMLVVAAVVVETDTLRGEAPTMVRKPRLDQSRSSHRENIPVSALDYSVVLRSAGL